MNRALITGIGGQDGAYLTRLLLEKGYEVHGITRRSSIDNVYRLTHILTEEQFQSIHLHEGELTDPTFLIGLIERVKPTEIYNLGAQSHVATSYKNPIHVFTVDTEGPLAILEAMRILNLQNECRFYQASTSEMFGSSPPPQNEVTNLAPESPYATAKLAAHWLTRIYRDGYGLFACSGILFNHESPLRGSKFVTRKTSTLLAKMALNRENNKEVLKLGNLNSMRDWGHAADYVKGMWMMLQRDTAEDFVLATGQQQSVRDFVNTSLRTLGVEASWHGAEIGEHAICNKVYDPQRTPGFEEGQRLVEVSAEFYRPLDNLDLCGDYSKAQKVLGWKPQVSFRELVQEMLESDLSLQENNTVKLTH